MLVAKPARPLHANCATQAFKYAVDLINKEVVTRMLRQATTKRRPRRVSRASSANAPSSSPYPTTAHSVATTTTPVKRTSVSAGKGALARQSAAALVTDTGVQPNTAPPAPASPASPPLSPPKKPASGSRRRSSIGQFFAGVKQPSAGRPPAIGTRNLVGTFGLASPPARGANASEAPSHALNRSTGGGGMVGDFGSGSSLEGRHSGHTRGVVGKANGSNRSRGESGYHSRDASGESDKIAILSALATEASTVVSAGTLTPLGLLGVSPPSRGAISPRLVTNVDSEEKLDLSRPRARGGDNTSYSRIRIGVGDDSDSDSDERSDWSSLRLASSKPFTSSRSSKPYSTAGSHQRGLSSPTSRVREVVVAFDSSAEAFSRRPRGANSDSEEEEKRPETESDENDAGLAPTGGVRTGASVSRSILRSSAAAAAAATSDRTTQDGVGGYGSPRRGVTRAKARRWSVLGAKAAAGAGIGGGTGGKTLGGGGSSGGGGGGTALARPSPGGSPGAKGDGPPPPPSRMQEQRRRSSIPLTEGLLPLGASSSSASTGVVSNARRRSVQRLGAWMASGAVEDKSSRLPSSLGARDVGTLTASSSSAVPADYTASAVAAAAEPYARGHPPALTIASPRARGRVGMV